MKKASRLTQGYVICFVGTVLWSTTAIFIRFLTETYHLPALVLAFWRDLTLSLCLGLVFLLFNRARLRLPPGQWRFLLVYGLILSLFNSTWTISVALNGAAVSTVMAYSSAAFTAVMAWRWYGERLGPIKILAVSLSLLGCVFTSGAYDPSVWQLNPVGVFTGLVSGVAFAAYSLMGKEASQRSINSWTVLLYAFGFAAGFLLIYNQLTPWLPQGVASTNLLWLGDAYLGWGVLFALAIGPTVGGYGLYTLSLNYLPASVANVIATLEPAMTGLQAFVLLGERFSAPQWIGSALILAGVVVLRKSEEQDLKEEIRKGEPAPQADPDPVVAARRAATFRQGLRYQGAILCDDRHILLILHQEHNGGRAYWLLPGGGREAGESEEACVVREMKEETNLDVAIERLLLDEQWDSDHGYKGAKTYLCRVVGGQAAPGYEPEIEASSKYAIAQVAWFDLCDETSWGETVRQDAITYGYMQKIRAALGYPAGNLADSLLNSPLAGSELDVTRDQDPPRELDPDL